MFNRTVVNIVLHKTIQWNKKLTYREQDREQQEAEAVK